MQPYAVVLEKAESNWAAYVSDLPGCISTGATLPETKRNFREAIQLHFEATREVEEPIPMPSRMSISLNWNQSANTRQSFVRY